MGLEEIDIVLRVGLAMLLGGVIGLEREFAHKPAGIRTHMFVAGAAALVINIGYLIVEEFEAGLGSISADPARILEAVIVGISFIGAGTVLKSSKTHHVYFLTTAASILFTAVLGMAVALDRFVLAVGLTLLAVFVNYAVGSIEQHFIRSREDINDES
ncbi:MAG: MgtC/SapB family protein [Candidatus Saccharimonadales bacterium]|nr:MgtC/SapB family protein [Candidatus Saccharimonadales bacterium]